MKRKKSQPLMQTRLQQAEPAEPAGSTMCCASETPAPEPVVATAVAPSPSPSPPPATTPTPPEASAAASPPPEKEGVEITAEHVRELGYLLERVARRVLDNEKLLKTTMARLADLETAVSVQTTTQSGFSQVIDGHRRAIGALGGRHNAHEHSIVATRASLEEQAEELAALRALVAQNFVDEAVNTLDA